MGNTVGSEISLPIPPPPSLLHCPLPSDLHILCPRALPFLFPFRAQIKGITFSKSICIISFLDMPKGRCLMYKLDRVRKEGKVFPNTQVDAIHSKVQPGRMPFHHKRKYGCLLGCLPQRLQEYELCMKESRNVWKAKRVHGMVRREHSS